MIRDTNVNKQNKSNKNNNNSSGSNKNNLNARLPPGPRLKKVLATVAQWERHAMKFCQWRGEPLFLYGSFPKARGHNIGPKTVGLL